MGSTYSRLTPAELTRIFQPQQRLEVVLNRTTQNGLIDPISLQATISKCENDQIILTLIGDNINDLNLLRAGRVIALHTGRSNATLTFKSKIIDRNLDKKEIVIETPKMMSSKERRGGPRVPLSIPVIYRVLSFRNQKLHHLSSKIGKGESQDIALGGITLLTDLKLPVGLVLALEFTFEGEQLALNGVIRRSEAIDKIQNSYAIGIKFLDPHLAQQEIINKIVESAGVRLKGNIQL